ncbi:hypothetical protein Are01nite_24790 [Actinoplanes regularis]|nr:hypothetical protein Are01nite_24790 [Actinoplanes regularis]
MNRCRHAAGFAAGPFLSYPCPSIPAMAIPERVPIAHEDHDEDHAELVPDDLGFDPPWDGSYDT